MATVKDIYRYLDSRAPFSSQLGFDNAGFLVGRGERRIRKMMISLDITRPVIEEAEAMGAQLIVSHHPVIWDPLKAVTDETVPGRKLLSLAEYGIAAICAHTNLDAAEGGVNDALAAAIGLQNTCLLKEYGRYADGRPYGIERIGLYPSGPVSFKQFSAHVKLALSAASLRCADAGKPVRKVAVGGGSCSSALDDALAAGCDTFVTADVKYDTFLDAKAKGINLIDAGHFATENVVTSVLARWLAAGFPDVEILLSQLHREPYFSL